jgi:hypothetical protein
MDLKLLASPHPLPRALLFLLLSAATAAAEMEIEVEREGEALIVRSAIEEGNFLFRVDASFERVPEPPEPYLLELDARSGEQAARLLLRIEELAPGDARLRLGDLLRRRTPFLDDLEEPSEVEMDGAGERLVARLEGRSGKRRVARAALGVRDGTRLYLLVLDLAPPGGALADAFAGIADGFTILDPKGSVVPQAPSSEELKPRTIEHDYYRLKLLKPAGFVEQEVDPDKDQGIYLHLRREDEVRNLCEVRIRVHLTRTLEQGLQEIAQARIDRFEGKYLDAKVPKRPKRGRWSGAKLAYKFKLIGKQARGGIVVVEEWRFVEHENGRTYEIQMTLYGAAEREWRKDLSAFWRKLKIINR